MKMPGAERAVVDMAKLRDYLLSPGHRVGGAKSRFFTQLGFEAGNWQSLRDELLRVALGNAKAADSNRFGEKYVVLGTIQGPTGRSAPVVVVWIVLHGEDTPRFVTAYPGAKS
jgi:hypothetical protein